MNEFLAGVQKSVSYETLGSVGFFTDRFLPTEPGHHFSAQTHQLKSQQ
jgi:hypothetical protein